MKFAIFFYLRCIRTIKMALYKLFKEIAKNIGQRDF